MFDNTDVHPVYISPYMSPLAIVFSRCSWPAGSSRVKLQTKFCISSSTPQAVIGGGLHTLGSVLGSIIIYTLHPFFDRLKLAPELHRNINHSK